MSSLQQNLALSSDEFLSPSQQLDRALKRQHRPHVPIAAAAAAAAASSSSSSYMFPMSQETNFSQSTSSGWTAVENREEGHARGSVVEICGGKVLMELRIPGEAPFSREVGPFPTVEQKTSAVAGLQRELVLYNRQRECFTNGFGFQLPDRETVRMFLDADFSEDSSKTVLFDAVNLDFVLLRQWGARKLKADGKWYAFSKDGDGTVIWLHDYILSQRGARLASFNNSNTRDCREDNMRTTKLVQAFTRPGDIISVSLKKSSKSNDGFTNLIYEQSGKRWKFTWKRGETTEYKHFYDSKHGNNTASSKQEALEFREAKIAEQLQQAEDNAAFQEAWFNRPEVAEEMATQPESRIQGITKNPFPPAKSANSLNVGPWLRGSVTSHAEGLWCARLGEHFVHCESRAEALEKLHALNVQKNASVNSYGTRMEQDGKVRCILLEGCTSRSAFAGGAGGCMFVISDNEKVAAALAEHVWKVNVTAETPEGQASNWEAVNLDPSSVWQKAEDLVTFVKLQDLKSGSNKSVIGKPEDFFKVVSIKKRSRTWDCRFNTIECAIVDQEAIHKKAAQKAEKAIKSGKEPKPEKVECVDSLGYMKLSNWSSERKIDVPTTSSPMALAAIEAINSGAALYDGPGAEQGLVAKANAVAASSMGDIEEEEEDD